MTYYAVVLIEHGEPIFTFAGKTPFITSIKHLAEDHVVWLKDNWAEGIYQIVEFQVELS